VLVALNVLLKLELACLFVAVAALVVMCLLVPVVHEQTCKRRHFCNLVVYCKIYILVAVIGAVMLVCAAVADSLYVC